MFTVLLQCYSEWVDILSSIHSNFVNDKIKCLSEVWGEILTVVFFTEASQTATCFIFNLPGITITYIQQSTRLLFLPVKFKWADDCFSEIKRLVLSTWTRKCKSTHYPWLQNFIIFNFIFESQFIACRCFFPLLPSFPAWAALLNNPLHCIFGVVFDYCCTVWIQSRSPHSSPDQTDTPVLTKQYHVVRSQSCKNRSM